MKRILSVFLAAFLLLTALPLAAQADLETTGTCGEEVTWSFDPASGELLITGNGPMEEFNDPSPFCGLSEIRTLTIEAGVTSIGYGAFSNCLDLTDVTIPDSVAEIGGYAFSGCEALECITIPDSVMYVDSNAFEGCSSLSQARLGSGITSVADELFSGCCALTDVVIPETVTEIGTWSFGGCTSLVSVTVPDSVESIGAEAFYGCESLQSVTIGNRVTTIGSAAFFNCSALESITIPNSVTCIEEEAFSGCSSLNSVTIGSGVGNIGADAFSQCAEELEIYYVGSREAWEAISIDESNEALLSAEIHYNATHEHVAGGTDMALFSDATCTKPAVYLAVTHCTICGEELFSEPIEDGEPLGHAFGAWETAATPTCTLPGEAQRSCSRCGAVETQPISASGHTPGEAVHENETAPACETAGSYDAVIYCSVCGDELSRETQTIPASGHTPGEAVRENEIPAACETAGSYDAVVYCTICGDELSRETKPEGAPLDHDWDNGVVTLAPTCSDCGTQVFTCKRAGCGATKEEELKPVPGAHVWKQAEIVPPTCTDQGYTMHACARCRYGYSDDYVGALGHSFTIYSSNHDATCTADGTKTATCDRCTETNTVADKGSAFGHRPGKPVRENEKAAFCETDGSYDEVVYCTKCGNETGRTTHRIEKLGHVDTGNDGTCDRCGRQMTGGSHCAFCGKIHGGAFGWLIRFFHRILAWFK